MPIVGQSLQLKNLYFFTAFSSANLAFRVQAAKDFVNYFVEGADDNDNKVVNIGQF